ncbi:hypothetical protein CDL15_Pgr025160 [Punica granatum]|uniref:Uncharacterized protein n=1 Tax=Punica granatum TaxID=22663 RepID=A0A218W8U5_PUNGR|nr:hypothetical protein CDL15_Pgr025160 [Punica granatum]
MREKFSCFSENSISFSQPSSSHPSSVPSTSTASTSLLPSIQNTVTSVYRSKSPSTQKPLFISLSWFRSLVLGQSSLTIGFAPDPDPASPSSLSFKLISSSSGLFKKNKGSKRIDLEKSRVEVFWDFANARFDRGPEPLNGFYILVVVGSQLGLFLGDMAEEAVEKKFKSSNPMTPKFALVSRREHCSEGFLYSPVSLAHRFKFHATGNGLYGTRCQFGVASSEHDILIRISEGGEGLNRDPILYVYIDKKKVMRVKRLQWNFRGSQTIFVDGTDLMIDMLWDVHDWFFNQASEGRGVFMFTTRSGLLDGKFWVEDGDEKLAEKLETDHKADDFSLFIYATKHS